MNWYKFSFFLCFSFLILGCAQKPSYSVALVGHAYGKPLGKSLGVYPPLKSELLKGKENYIFFLGDFVRTPNLESYKFLKKDLKAIKAKPYFVAGNHDLINPDLFASEIGPTFYSEMIRGVKYIILDGTKDNWNIKGDQLDFLKEEMKNYKGKLFIMVHQLIWCSHKEFEAIEPNSKAGMADTLTFWDEVFPLLQGYENDVYVCSGDLGAFKSIHNPVYGKFDNVTFLASGMGANYRDNYIRANFFEDGKIQFEVVSLQPDLYFDDLEDMGPYCN